LKSGKEIPLGNISKGVANGSAGSPIIDGSRTAKPMLHAIVPRITTGKIYKRSQKTKIYGNEINK
jgi:hypothetical protein